MFYCRSRSVSPGMFAMEQPGMPMHAVPPPPILTGNAKKYEVLYNFFMFKNTNYE